MMKEFCPVCCVDTVQVAAYLFPEDEESPLVYVCTCCGQEVDIIDETLIKHYERRFNAHRQ